MKLRKHLYFGLKSYQVYGQNATLRSAEDIAYHVALFIARKNGTFINYYMVNLTPTKHLL